ncbi:sensor histidine kinase [Photobacterium lucens]|uniref:sensor histidine kinase n=1 Tax=Photobacterium lucens TaxID=2562949 RepID=UPI00136AF424|nr:HAMP domain-containing sensor histidine kinase [Photobacterium lucens]MBP2698564.1 HAMP domain-containing histidine kinase [Vibrio parahaemolyticus]MZG55426.1 HAMP domain-containing histidine kinase [Photobacterium lucens]MZG81420.1 HAMP domain-containing histidine kinase [Photobacterium lucens]
MTKTRSIKSNLINAISSVFGLFIIIVFTFVDFSVDNWVQEQFELEIQEQAGQFKTITNIQAFADAISSDKDYAYYQIWKNDDVIYRSNSLSDYPNINLLHKKLPLNSYQIVDVTLPNREIGKAFLYSYLAKPKDQKPTPIYLTIYASTTGLDKVTGILDILLIGSFLLSMIIMRVVAKAIVNKGLDPLESLNNQIKVFNEDKQQRQSKTFSFKQSASSYIEVDLIRNELNNFLETNRNMVDNEKRITSDIAHEIKTPIAEIITLTEVHQRFPDDERLAKTFTSDILQISNRMKVIVENLLLLQRTSHSLSIYKVPIEITTLLSSVIHDLNFKYDDIKQRVVLNNTLQHPIIADEFCLKTIITNLLDNALFYSVPSTAIDIVINDDTQHVMFTITNQSPVNYSEQEVNKLVQPLFQHDDSRSNNDRYGLGLSIVDNICKINEYELAINQLANGEFQVLVKIPKKNCSE